MSDDAAIARRMWELVEPYHAVTYFAHESREAYEAVGLRGFWRGYFAGRAAPLGAVDAGAVVATFYGFRPEFVARAIPAVWQTVSPAQAIDARLAGVDAALRSLVADAIDAGAFRQPVELLQIAADACTPYARPLFAGNAALAQPDVPHLALWHLATLLREHRGDGHVAALALHEVGPSEAHVLRIAVQGAPPSTIQPFRGWNDDDWAAAASNLVERGWLDASRVATAAGRHVHAEVERATDRLASEPVRALGRDRCEALFDSLAPITRAIADAQLIPDPNPIGVPLRAR